MSENEQLEEVRLRTALMQERRLIANEVHDSLAQSLTFMRMRVALTKDALETNEGSPFSEGRLRALQYLAEIESSLAVTHGRVRQIITQYRAVPTTLGLIQGLEKEVADLNGLGGVHLSFKSLVDTLDLLPGHEIQVIYIVREALANIVKHARATRGRVTLSMAEGGYLLEIEDNGVGTQASTDGGEHGHYGLNIMRERAQYLGGSLVFESAGLTPRPGMRVKLFFPLSSG